MREWLRNGAPGRYAAANSCPTCGDVHDLGGLPAAYAYLLGLYLGDGCLAHHPRDVFKLRIFLDRKYPGIVDECSVSMTSVGPNGARRLLRDNCFEVFSYWKGWPCLLPQHGPGRKHERPIELADWQRWHVLRNPRLLLRGLIHSDGCRSINTGRGGWRNPRYTFSNVSDDIRRIFCETCDPVGIRWTLAPRTVYVSRKADVALLDEFIGPKR